MKLRVRAEAFCFRRDLVLCHWANGYVCFPGGGVDHNESPVQAAKREFMEEADRSLLNCTVAHEPTVQTWSEAYAKRHAWAAGKDGGLTYWMSGTTTQYPIHKDPANRHKDYEEAFAWQSIDVALAKLKKDLDGDFPDDAKVRILILETHQKMHAPHKASAFGGLRLPGPFLKVS